MAETIVASHGNRGECRMRRSEKGVCRRSFAAVMGDFQNVGMDQQILGDEVKFDLFFDIAGEEEGVAAVGEAEDQGVVILRGGTRIGPLPDGAQRPVR